ncbi:MAG TPA: hypothetical protein VK989_02750, partial [Polyangia bacterium]|nr:hypothetical protein [Polyangia bacterium]
METESGSELSPNAQRAAELIRDQVAVRWPAGHVEIALIELQRRRQQRRYAAAGATLSVGAVALALALGFGASVRDVVPARLLARFAPGAARVARSVTPASVAEPRPEPTRVAEPASPTPGRAASEPSPSSTAPLR